MRVHLTWMLTGQSVVDAFKKRADLEKPAEICIVLRASDESIELILVCSPFFVCYLYVCHVSDLFSGGDSDRPRTNQTS